MAVTDGAEDTNLAAQRGIRDRESGAIAAQRAVAAVSQLVAQHRGPEVPLDDSVLTLLGLFSRIQAQHEGAARELAADNPFAAASCLRSLAEVVAVICYLIEKPNELNRVSMNASRSDRFKIGPLIAAAGREAPGFAAVYDQLSNFAHPSFVGATTGMTLTDDGHFTWQAAPKFKNDDDACSMYLCLLELTEAAGPLWCQLCGRTKGAETQS